MKILHLIFSKQVAGAEMYLLNLLPGINKQGIECHLIFVIPKKNRNNFTWLIKQLNKEGVKAIIITSGIFNFLGAATKINRYLRNNNIKYLHSHLFKSDILAVMVNKLYNKRLHLISTRHGYQESYFKKNYCPPWKIVYNLYYYISKYILAQFDAHFAVSKAISGLYYDLKLTRSLVHYIHHGTNIQVDKSMLGQFRMSPKQLIIVGRIELIKGHKYLIEAMPGIIEQLPDIKLLVLGNGSEYTNLTNRINELGIAKYIVFLGFQQNPYGYIAHSDLIIQPSIFESFGLIYIEALALKTPVIAFNTQAANEIITNNETGILSPALDSNALKEKIIYLLKNPEDRKRIADNAYKKYVAHFTIERMITETVSWYRSFIPD